MSKQNTEEYIGAIYRLREKPSVLLPLSRLQDSMGFSIISIHEMVTKLQAKGLVEYIPYHGVALTASGEQTAANLIRRHRIWECFLTDMLGVSRDQVHALAHQLEHAAPDEVTERLSMLMGNPVECPHGAAIPQQMTMGSPEITREMEE